MPSSKWAAYAITMLPPLSMPACLRVACSNEARSTNKVTSFLTCPPRGVSKFYRPIPIPSSLSPPSLLQLLWENKKDFVTQGFVHSQKGAQILEKLGATQGDSEAIQASNAKLRAIGMPADDEDPDIFVGDIVNAKDLQPALRNCDALVICTSGVPKLRKRELAKSILFKLIGRQRMPQFYYDQMPEQVCLPSPPAHLRRLFAKGGEGWRGRGRGRGRWREREG